MRVDTIEKGVVVTLFATDLAVPLTGRTVDEKVTLLITEGTVTETLISHTLEFNTMKVKCFAIVLASSH